MGSLFSLRVPPPTTKRSLQWICTAHLLLVPLTTWNDSTCFVSSFRTDHNTCSMRMIAYEPNQIPPPILTLIAYACMILPNSLEYVCYTRSYTRVSTLMTGIYEQVGFEYRCGHSFGSCSRWWVLLTLTVSTLPAYVIGSPSGLASNPPFARFA